MTVPKPALNFDDLAVESIGVVPATNPEDLTLGYGLTELGASSEDDCAECDLGECGSCECDRMR